MWKVFLREDEVEKLESMVGPASPRVTSSEGLHQDDHHGEKHRLPFHPRGNPQHNWYSRQQNMKHYPGGDYPRRNGQRSNKGGDYKAEGVADVNGRNNPPSSASSSGRCHPPSNLDHFLEVTTPRVKTQILRKVLIFCAALSGYNCNSLRA